METLFTVSKNAAPGEYLTITEALVNLPSGSEPVTIHVCPGVYNEKFTINRDFVTLEGADASTTIITYGDYALMLMPDESKRGTFRTPTVMIDADDFMAKNLTFENSAGSGRIYGQALALYIDGDRICFDNCRLLGCQDTLFTAPLPPTAYQIGGFTGPKEFCERRPGRHYYHQCYIEGDVDFIFGGAVAYFEDCEIFSVKYEGKLQAKEMESASIHGYITAASTPQDQTYGYVFENCRLTSDCPKGSVYLGRPWRSFAKTVFLHCHLGDHIHPAGWHDWDKKDAYETIFYAEYKNVGPGADIEKRASFSQQLCDQEAALYTVEKVLCCFGHWDFPRFL